MFDASNIPMDPTDERFLKPVVEHWIQQLDSSRAARSRWDEICREIMMFYSRSAAAMWDQGLAKKFWTGNLQPRFRVSINLAFEYVAVMLPNLMWDNPHRQVEPKQAMMPPPGMFGQDEYGQQIGQQVAMEQQQIASRAKVTALLLQDWLNFTSREMPQGLLWHSTMATLDALLKGRGCLWSRPYVFPGTNRVVTGAFREPPENLLIDPAHKTLAGAGWIALRHVESRTDIESRFRLPEGSLRGRETMDSSSAGAMGMSFQIPKLPSKGDNPPADMMVWYEVWSKNGAGTSDTAAVDPIRRHLHESLGKYVYLAISPAVQWPLNCPPGNLVKETTDQVRERFKWPVDLFWKDDRWPVEVCDFYPNMDEEDVGAAWPIPPLGAALGEIKLLNTIIPFLVNRVWSSSRDFWTVLGPYLDHYQKYLEEGKDQCVIPTPAMVDDVRKAVSIIQQPESRRDLWELIGMIETLFRKRTGLTLTAYGMNEDGTQSRSAEETIAKHRAVGIRPEFMQRVIIDFESRTAESEAMVAQRFVRGQNMVERIGPTMAGMWDQLVAASGDESVVRQFLFTISASSIRRPNKEQQIANFQQVMQYWLGPITQFSAASGNYEPLNAMMAKWGDLHDQDMSALYVPDMSQQVQEAQQAQQQMAQQQMQMEQSKMQAELQGKQMDLQGKQVDIQAKVLDAQVQQQMAQQDLRKQAVETQLDAASKAQQLDFERQKAQQQVELASSKGLMEILHDRSMMQQSVQQSQVEGQIKVASTLQQAAAKAQAAKMQAKAKPKPQGKKK